MPQQRQRYLYFKLNRYSTYSGVFIINFEHISHLERRKKFQGTCLKLVKRKKSEFN